MARIGRAFPAKAILGHGPNLPVAGGPINITIDTPGLLTLAGSTLTATSTSPLTGDLVRDTFDRADAGTLGTADFGGSWTAASGTWSIVGNKAQRTGGAIPQNSYATIDPGTADVDIRTRLTISPTADRSNAGINFRVSGANDYLFVKIEATALHNRLTLMRNIDGVGSQIIATDTTLTYVNGDTYDLRVRADGTSVRVYVDDFSTALIDHTLTGSDVTDYTGSPCGPRVRMASDEDDGGSTFDWFEVFSTAVALDAGRITLTGSPLTTTTATALGAGTITLAGQPLTAIKTTALTAGGIVLAGKTLTSSTTVAVTAGGVILTGSTITQTVSVVIPLTAGTITLTGQTLAQVLATTITLTPGTVTLTGSSLAVATTHALAGGRVLLTGSTITQTVASVIPLTAGLVTLAGQPLAVATVHTLTAGLVTLTGQTLTQTTFGGITLDAGRITLTGSSLAATATMALAKGTLTLTGQTITQQIARVITLDTAGRLTVAGSALTFTVRHSLASGGLSLAGQGIGVNRTIAVSAGFLSLQGRTFAVSILHALEGGRITFAGGEVFLAGLGTDIADTFRAFAPYGGWTLEIVNPKRIGQPHGKRRVGSPAGARHLDPPDNLER